MQSTMPFAPAHGDFNIIDTIDCSQIAQTAIKAKMSISVSIAVSALLLAMFMCICLSVYFCLSLPFLFIAKL